MEKWKKGMQKGSIKEDNFKTRHLPQVDPIACPQETDHHLDHCSDHHFLNHERFWHVTGSSLEEHHLLFPIHHKIPISGLYAPEILPM